MLGPMILVRIEMFNYDPTVDDREFSVQVSPVNIKDLLT